MVLRCRCFAATSVWPLVNDYRRFRRSNRCDPSRRHPREKLRRSWRSRCRVSRIRFWVKFPGPHSPASKSVNPATTRTKTLTARCIVAANGTEEWVLSSARTKRWVEWLDPVFNVETHKRPGLQRWNPQHTRSSTLKHTADPVFNVETHHRPDLQRWNPQKTRSSTLKPTMDPMEIVIFHNIIMFPPSALPWRLLMYFRFSFLTKSPSSVIGGTTWTATSISRRIKLFFLKKRFRVIHERKQRSFAKMYCGCFIELRPSMATPIRGSSILMANFWRTRARWRRRSTGPYLPIVSRIFPPSTMRPRWVASSSRIPSAIREKITRGISRRPRLTCSLSLAKRRAQRRRQSKQLERCRLRQRRAFSPHAHRIKYSMCF